MKPKEDFCEKHNKKKDSVKVGDFFVYSCQECRIENERGADVMEELKKKQEKEISTEAKAKLYETADIPPRFDRDLSQFETSTADQKKAFTELQSFLRVLNTKTGAIFLGAPGTGKTHLAIYCLQQCLAWKKTGRFVEAVKIFRAVKESWSHHDGPRESQILKNFVQPFVLVIDEIGVQVGSETERMIITEIINDRYNAMKPTILCGNLSKTEMKACIGERAWDRFEENGLILALKGESYRLKQAIRAVK